MEPNKRIQSNRDLARLHAIGSIMITLQLRWFVCGKADKGDSVMVLLRKFLPWRMKLFLKIFLKFLPLNYSQWRSLNLFLHGRIPSPEYALSAFNEFAFKYFTNQMDTKPHGDFWTGKRILELGPGDSIYSGLIANALGAERTYLVDVGPFVTKQLQIYRHMAKYLKTAIPTTDFKPNFKDFETLLTSINTIYYTNGINSLKKIEDQSIDFVFSNAVLEHVNVEDLPSLFSETARILKPNGAAVHRIDFRDHLSGRFNHLRFSSIFWESKVIRNAGIYVNRLPYSILCSIIEKSDLTYELIRAEPSNENGLNVKVHKSAPIWTVSDLSMQGCDILIKIPAK